MPICTRITLIIAGLALLPNTMIAQSAEHISSYTWAGSSAEYGGFSGIEVSDDGMRFVIIGDKGVVVDGIFQRTEQTITGVFSTLQQLKNRHGDPLTKAQSDAEGLAIRTDGHVFISFEHRHRIWSYTHTSSIAEKLEKHPDFKHFKGNDGLEALAISADGTLYALAEKPENNLIPIYRYQGGQWDVPFHIPARHGYKPVGADFGPDGKFYLLERRLTSIFGFSNQIRRFEITGNQISKGELLLETDAGVHGNLEGLALWRDQHGDIRLTMIADDNFNMLQRTEFVEYRIQE